MMPVNSQQPNQSVVSRYLQWLISSFGSPNAQQQSPSFTTAMPIAPQETTVAPTTSGPTGQEYIGRNYGAPMSIGSFVAPAPGTSDLAAQMSAAGMTPSAPVDLSKVNPADVSRFLQMAALSQYGLNNLNRDYLTEAATQWEAMQKYPTDPNTGEPLSRHRLEWEGYLQQDPTDARAARMLTLLDEVLAGKDSKQVIDENGGLSESEKASISGYGDDINAYKDFQASLVPWAASRGFALPNEQWSFDPNAIARLGLAKTEGPNKGMTELQIQQRALDQILQENKDTAKPFIPENRSEIEARLMASQAPQALSPIVSNENMNKADLAAIAAIKSKTKGGASPDRIESAAKQAAAQVLASIKAPSNAKQYVFGNKSKPIENKFLSKEERAKQTADAAKQKEMQRKVEEEVWKQGYKAMRGETVGVNPPEMVSSAKERVRIAQQQQDQLAQEVAAEFTRRYGTPLEFALQQAKSIINANSKELDPVMNYYNSYPFNVR